MKLTAEDVSAIDNFSKAVEVLRREIRTDLRSASREVAACVLLRAFKRQGSFLGKMIVSIVETIARIAGKSKNQIEAIQAKELMKDKTFNDFMTLVVENRESTLFIPKNFAPFLSDMKATGWYPSDDFNAAYSSYYNSYEAAVVAISKVSKL